jgi:hypothetical protein
MLQCVEVSSTKTINIKQYLNTNNFSSNLHKQHNFILQKYFINNSVVISFIFIVLGLDTSTQGSREGIHRCDKGSIGGRGLTVCCVSSITRLKSHPTIHIKYCVLHFWRYSTSVFFILTWKKIIFRHKFGDTQRWQRFYWRQGPHCLLWTIM